MVNMHLYLWQDYTTGKAVGKDMYRLAKTSLGWGKFIFSMLQYRKFTVKKFHGSAMEKTATSEICLRSAVV